MDYVGGKFRITMTITKRCLAIWNFRMFQKGFSTWNVGTVKSSTAHFFPCCNPNLFFTFWVNNCTWKIFQRRIREVVVFFQVIKDILHKESVLQVSVCGRVEKYDLAARYTNWKGTICRAGCIWKISPLHGEGPLPIWRKRGSLLETSNLSTS